MEPKLVPWKQRSGTQCKACPDNKPPGYANFFVYLATNEAQKRYGSSHGKVCFDCAMRFDR